MRHYARKNTNVIQMAIRKCTAPIGFGDESQVQSKHQVSGHSQVSKFQSV